MSNDTGPRRVLVIGHSHALAVALATPIRDAEVLVSREPYAPAESNASTAALLSVELPRVILSPTVAMADALAHLRRPKREGNRAERRAKGRGR